MPNNHRPSIEAENQIAGKIWGVAVYLQTKPPHQGDFLWRIFDRQTDATVAEGYDCDITCAVFKAQEKRRHLLRSLHGTT